MQCGSFANPFAIAIILNDAESQVSPTSKVAMTEGSAALMLLLTNGYS